MSRSLAETDPAYDNCPRSCPDEDGRRLTAFCESCPQRSAIDGFAEATVEQLDAEIGPAWRRYGLDALRSAVVECLDLAEARNVALTSAVEKGVRIVIGERERLKRIDEWNDRQKTRTN